MQMLIKTMQQNNANEQQNSESGSHKQQEAVFAQQREEVLLGVVESLREQLNAAERDMEAEILFTTLGTKSAAFDPIG